jgi:hypothetical protein
MISLGASSSATRLTKFACAFTATGDTIGTAGHTPLPRTSREQRGCGLRCKDLIHELDETRNPDSKPGPETRIRNPICINICKPERGVPQEVAILYPPFKPNPVRPFPTSDSSNKVHCKRESVSHFQTNGYSSKTLYSFGASGSAHRRQAGFGHHLQHQKAARCCGARRLIRQ